MYINKVFLYLISLFGFIFLSGCTFDADSAIQEKATGLWPEMVAGATYGQSFTSSLNNLYRIDLSTATYARTNTAPVIFHLRKSQDSSIDIATITLPGSEIQNDRPTAFVFSKQANSRGKSYYFFIESPESRPGNAVTVYANSADQLTDGSAYQNGKIVPGDLTFRAYSQEDLSISSIGQDFISRASKDIPFFILYIVLILVTVVSLLISLINRKTQSTQK